MPKSQKKTKYNEIWKMENQSWTWLSRSKVGDTFSAFCSWCKVEFSVSTMGKSAISSHEKCKKHQGFTRLVQQNATVTPFFQNSPAKGVANTPSEDQQPLLACQNVVLQPATASTSTVTVAEKPSGNILSNFTYRDEVTKAEILWCLYSVISKLSLRQTADALNIFKLMFCDSDIARKISCQKDKVCYSIVFGLCPYFQDMLLKKLHKATHFVVGFDESLNKVSQKQQMDLTVRFWDRNTVVCRYLNSTFMGHTTAFDILENFKQGLLGLNIKKLLQISMDGPNVNKKFLKCIQSEIVTDDPQSPVLLDIGSCGLHTLHNAFKAGLNITGWNIIQFLRAIYNLFKNVPARRDDFIRFSNSKLFPKKFCAVRWLENIQVAQRAISIIPSLKKYLAGVQSEKTKFNCGSYNIVKDAVSDILLVAKLEFFISVASELEPFLRDFQSDKPLAPYLWDSLGTILKHLMSKIVKPSVVEKADNINKLIKINLSDKQNIIISNKIELGFGVKSALRNSKANERQILQLKQECLKCYTAVIQKLLEKSPLSYKFTRGILCLAPTAVLNCSKVGSIRLKVALEILIENKWFTGSQSDNIFREYNLICASKCFTDAAQSLSFNDRLDNFWASHIGTNEKYKHLFSFVKIILILSHGNASVERGFSVNKEILVDNVSNDSLIAQRTVYDAAVSMGGVKDVEITPSLMSYFRNSNSKWKQSLAQKLKKDESVKNAAAINKQISKEITDLQHKKKCLLSETDLINDAVDSLKKKLV